MANPNALNNPKGMGRELWLLTTEGCKHYAEDPLQGQIALVLWRDTGLEDQTEHIIHWVITHPYLPEICSVWAPKGPCPSRQRWLFILVLNLI